MRIYHGLGLFLSTVFVTNSIVANELTSNDSAVAVEFIMAPASKIKLSFDEIVTLDSLTFNDMDGYWLNLNIQVPKGESKVFSVEIPSLMPTDYVVLWQVHNHDNVAKKGTLKLTIEDDDSYPRASTKKHKYAILHNKLHH